MGFLAYLLINLSGKYQEIPPLYNAAKFTLSKKEINIIFYNGLERIIYIQQTDNPVSRIPLLIYKF